MACIAHQEWEILPLFKSGFQLNSNYIALIIKMMFDFDKNKGLPTTAATTVF
jgi:hypothetical protein